MRDGKARRDAKKMRFGLNITTVHQPRPNTTRLDRKEWFPVMAAVKQTTVRDKAAGFPVVPSPVGWLYWNYTSPQYVFYASGKPDNMSTSLFTWDTAIAFENKSPYYYKPFVTRQGDVIWVWRGETQTDAAKGRQNPIIYPYDTLTGAAIDFGADTKPTSWLQSAGADMVYASAKQYLFFAEYTRTIHDKAYIWKVVPPYTSKANWSIVFEKTVSGSDTVGFKHFHSMQYDTFSGAWLGSSGDDVDNALIYMSIDDGANWPVVASGDQGKCRLANLAFDEDYIYWGSDQYNNHVFNRCGRDSNGYPDFTTRELLCPLPYRQATYASVLLHNPPGVLLLDRYDGFPAGTITKPLKVCFWSFETNSLHIVAEIEPLTYTGFDPTVGEWGFRGEGVQTYQSTSDKRIMCGFGLQKNQMKVLNNCGELSPDDEIYNLALEVVRIV